MLRTLARLYDLQLSFTDVAGLRRQASAEALRRVLSSLGAKVDSAEDVRASLHMRQEMLAQRVCSPTLVAWNGDCRGIQLRLPRGDSDRALRIELHLEDGSQRELSSSASSEGRAVYGAKYEPRRLDVSDKLPIGYHSLRVHYGQTSTTSKLIAAPQRAYQGDEAMDGRHWGVVTPAYALRSDRNWGCGDLADLADLWRWLRPRGGQVMGTLPLMAAHLQDPFDPSPYAPLSRRTWNELYAAIDRLPEFADCQPARDLAASAPFQQELQALRNDALIDYRRQCLLRRGVLELLSADFFQRRGPRWSAMQQALRDDPLLEDYARFRAVWERQARPWPQWPDRQRSGRIEPGDYDQSAFEYHLYAQWATRVQMAELSAELRAAKATLYLDYPVGVHGHGYDAWRHADLFVPSVTVGAPPDAVFTKGQDWGLAPLSGDRLQASGFRYFMDSVRCQMQHAGALRIDHVMGLHRLFWIPAGLSAAAGVYANYPAEELYAVLSLESHRHGTRLCGENLGTVPAAVDRGLKRHGIGGTYVVQYEVQPHPQKPLKAPQHLSVASINTHDMPTLAAYWQGLEFDDLFKLGLFDEAGIEVERQRRTSIREALTQYLRHSGHLAGPLAPDAVVVDGGAGAEAISSVRNALLAWLAQSDARYVLIGLEDLWLELLPQNVPGTSGDWPNWRRKLRFSLDEMDNLPELDQALRQINRVSHGSLSGGP